MEGTMHTKKQLSVFTFCEKLGHVFINENVK